VAPTHAYRGPGVTMATACLESIFKEYGYGHTKLVLMSVAETKYNARELTSPVLWAVSDLAAAHPSWASRVTDWLSAFDKIDLGKLRAFAKRNADAVRVRSGLATLLFGFLNSSMDAK
jgi:hypothetical protein